MGVLSSLLPGLRDIRAPLAAGYLWLFVLWLWFADRVPSREEAMGVLADIYRLDSFVSQVGVVVAVSFLAYLLGAVASSASNGILALMRRLPSSSLMGRVQQLLMVSSQGESRLAGLRWSAGAFLGRLDNYRGRYALFVRERDMSLREGIDPEFLPPRPEFEHYLGWTDTRLANHSPPLEPFLLESDLRVVRARLMAEQTALYGEYDRLTSEAEFRVAIALPLLILVVTMALDNPLWLVALLGLGLLLAQAVNLQARANEALVESVLSGKVKSAYLEDLALRVDQIRQDDAARRALAEPHSSGNRVEGRLADTYEEMLEMTGWVMEAVDATQPVLEPGPAPPPEPDPERIRRVQARIGAHGSAEVKAILEKWAGLRNRFFAEAGYLAMMRQAQAEGRNVIQDFGDSVGDRYMQVDQKRKELHGIVRELEDRVNYELRS